MESYLRVKWGLPLADGTDVPNDASVSAMTLGLSNGAVLELGGSKAHVIGALGGVGMVTEGSLTVAGLNQVTSDNPQDVLALASSLTVSDGASWAVAATSGSVVPVRSAAGIAFLGGGALTVSGGAALADGSHLLAAAVDGSALTGFIPGSWPVASDDRARQFSVTVEGNAVYLTVSGKGTVLMLK